MAEALIEWRKQYTAKSQKGSEGVMLGREPLKANDGLDYTTLLKVLKRDIEIWKSLQQSLGFQLSFVLPARGNLGSKRAN